HLSRISGPQQTTSSTAGKTRPTRPRRIIAASIARPGRLRCCLWDHWLYLITARALIHFTLLLFAPHAVAATLCIYGVTTMHIPCSAGSNRGRVGPRCSRSTSLLRYTAWHAGRNTL